MKKSGLKVKKSQVISPRKLVKKSQLKKSSKKVSLYDGSKKSSKSFESQIYHDPPSPRNKSKKSKKKSRQPLKNITNTLRNDGIHHYGHKSSPKRIKSSLRKRSTNKRKRKSSDGGKRRKRSPLKLRK